MSRDGIINIHGVNGEQRNQTINIRSIENQITFLFRYIRAKITPGYTGQKGDDKLKKTSFKAKQDAKMLANTIINKLDNINRLMLGDVDISFDKAGGCDSYTNKESDILLKGNLPKYINTMSENIEILYQFADSITDIRLLPDAKRILATMYPLMEFLAIEHTNKSESQFNNIALLIKTVESKIKLHTEESVCVGNVAQLAQVTTMGVIQAIKRNQLKAKKIGNTWFVDSENAMKWLTMRE